jgi:hypothetical protein
MISGVYLGSMMIVGNQLSRRQVWTINGRFTAQEMTGVQRYAREVVSAIDQILDEDNDLARRLGFELVVPRKTQYELNLARMLRRRTYVGSGHAWDQFVLPGYQKCGVLSLGNFGPVLARRHIVCIHDANTFLEPASYSPMFRTFYRTMLPVIGMRALKVATVSRFSADMLIRHGVCISDKIFLAPNGQSTPCDGMLVEPNCPF